MNEILRMVLNRVKNFTDDMEKIGVRVGSQPVNESAKREHDKQIAWTLYHGGYDLTPEQRELLRLAEDEIKGGDVDDKKADTQS